MTLEHFPVLQKLDSTIFTDPKSELPSLPLRTSLHLSPLPSTSDSLLDSSPPRSQSAPCSPLLSKSLLFDPELSNSSILDEQMNSLQNKGEHSNAVTSDSESEEEDFVCVEHDGGLFLFMFLFLVTLSYYLC